MNLYFKRDRYVHISACSYCVSFSVSHVLEECNNACDDELCEDGRKPIIQTNDREEAQWESQQGGKLLYVCHLQDY